MGDDSEFLIDGEWIALSAAPREWLEEQFLAKCEQVHELHSRVEVLTQMVDAALRPKPKRPPKLALVPRVQTETVQ